MLCLRELLGALQTLTWDKQCLKGVLQSNVIHLIIEYCQSTDQECCVLATATLANVLYYADSLLLADHLTLEALGVGMPSVLESLKNSHHRPQRFYALAAIANASSHPRLAEILKTHRALQLVRDVERQSMANLHILGSRMADCAQAALYKLSDQKEGNSSAGTQKFR